MFRIRTVPQGNTPANREVIASAQAMLREQFPGLDAADIDKLPEQLRDPVSFGFVSRLFVAESSRGKLAGLALLLYFSDIDICYLELITAAPGGTGRGVGDALYGRVRGEAQSIGAEALFFECLPDDPALSPDRKVRAQNAARLKFYERFGARPIDGTAYETPVGEDSSDPPYLVVDMLDTGELPTRSLVTSAVKAILERKYFDMLPDGYIDMVLQSISEDPVRLRDFRYVKSAGADTVHAATVGSANDASTSEQPKAAANGPSAKAQTSRLLPVVMNDKHDIHHVHERGYVEAPARVRAIWKELERAGIAHLVPPRTYPNRHILEVQDARLVSFMQRTCQLAGREKSIYPYVFPVRNQTRPPKEQTVLAGYYCIDTFTPLNENAWLAARRAVDCTMTAADLLLDGEPCAYALVRPPGHHAESKVFGGFCYFANAAIAAQYLSHYGTVAILDIDYHHGNGQQDIFYERSDVFTVSIHGDPEFAYPYFSGFTDEKGIGSGAGFNVNLTLPETITPERFHRTLATALKHIRQFQPDYLVLAAGFDTAKGDPTGTWSNLSKDFLEIGRAIGQQGFPVLVVQEGGYRVRSLGINVRQFFVGMSDGQKQAVTARRADSRQTTGKSGTRTSARVNGAIQRNQITDLELARVALRDAVRVGDTERIRSLAGATGVFNAEEITFAGELVEERLARGAQSGYDFVLAEHRGRLLGYSCYGQIEGTDASFDLYWIVVDPELQGRGLGRRLLEQAEKNMRDAGVQNIYVDTSSTDAYVPTRKFYESMGYAEAARLPNFYRPGDSKVIFCKRFGESM